MNKLLSLIKVDLMHSYSINNLKKKHNKKRNIGSLIATIILGAFLFLCVFIFSFSMGFLASEANQLDFLLVFGYTIASFMCFTVTISKANGFLFEAKDFELLMSMPINTKTIVLSKLISLLILNYLSFGLITVPTFVVYGIFSGAGLIYYLIAIVSVLTGPLLIVTICSFISYFLGIAFRKVKAKSIIMSIFSLIIFTVVFLLYMTFINKMEYAEDPNIDIMEYYGTYFSDMKNNFMTYYPISKLLAEGMMGNILYYALYLLIMIAPFSLLVVFVGKNFLKANMRAKISYTDKNFKLKHQKKNSKTFALIKRDLKRFFSSSTQVLNIGIGPIMSTILMVVMAINFKNASESEMDNEFLKGFLPLMLTLTVGFTFGIMPSTSSSISLEGKNFWIIKSAPINTRDVFLSKVLFYLLICFPFIVANTIIMYILIDISILNTLIAFLIQIVLTLVYSVEGLWINILTPKFDWDNEVKAIKQGTGPLLSMLFGFALGAFMYITPFIAFSFGLNGLVFLLINAIITLLIMCLILFTHGKKRYEKLQA